MYSQDSVTKKTKNKKKQTKKQIKTMDDISSVQLSFSAYKTDRRTANTFYVLKMSPVHTWGSRDIPCLHITSELSIYQSIYTCNYLSIKNLLK